MIDTTFGRLTITAPGKIVTFEPGRTIGVQDELVLSRVTLRSAVNGSQWYLTLADPGGLQDVEDVTVRDSNAGGGQIIYAYGFSRDEGNNVNWEFILPAGTLFMLR